MEPSFKAFADELLLIKLAAIEQKETGDEIDLGRLAKNVAIGVGAFGLGYGTGKLITRQLPKYFKNLSAGQLKVLGHTAGGLAAGSGFALSYGIKRMMERSKKDAEDKRHIQAV